MKLTLLLSEQTKEIIALEDFLQQLVRNSPFKGNVFIAGGYVRDQLLGKPSKDIDLVITEPDGGIKFAEWVTKQLGIYSDTNPIIFPRFGTAKFTLRNKKYNGVDLSGIDIECVMTRTEKYDGKTRKPEVGYGTLKQDAERRDFTVNSLMKDLTTGKIIDPTGMGFEDLKNGIVRSAIDPNIIFAEDPLRMLRAIRFATKYNWNLPFGMIKAIKKNAEKIKNISSERIQDEFNKMLLTNNPADAVRLMQLTGLTDYTMPELNKLVNLQQNKYHKDDAFKHSLEVLKNVPADLKTRLAALFHDIGKADTKSIIDNEIHFYKHEEVGADIAKAIMQRLKYPNEIIDAVYSGITNHMRLKQSGKEGQDISDKALRKFQRELGDHLEMTLDVMNADNISHADDHKMAKQIPGIRNRLSILKQPEDKVKLPINGNDIMTQLNIKPGPIIKHLLAAVQDAHDENPNLSPEAAMQTVKQKYQEKTPDKLSHHIPDKIRNPTTGNDILVKSALTYPENHPARQKAEKLFEK